MELDGCFLAILTPLPLLDGACVPFYDGQPRRKDGRFDFGKRVDVAATLGIPGVVTVPEAMTMLSRGILARDAQGREVRFGDRLVGKYVAGLGRASTDADRLRSVGRAALAVRSANAGIVELPGHRPVQRQYLHRLGAKGAIVVYVEAETGQVRGFIYTTARAAAPTPSYEKCVGEDAKCGASPTRRTKSLALPLRSAACPTARPSSAGHGLGRRPVCCVDEYTATTEEAKGSTDSYCRSIGPQRQKAPHSRRPWGACRQGGSSVSGSSYGQASSHPHNQYQARHHGESLFACCVC